MTTLQTVKLPMREVVDELTVSIVLSGVGVFRVRMWVGVKLIQLAMLVIGCKGEVEVRK